MNRREAGIAILIAAAISILIWVAVITVVLFALHLNAQTAR